MIDRPDHIPDLLRLRILFALIFLMLGVIMTRLWVLQIVKGQELAQEAQTQQVKRIRRVAARGLIEDCKGRVLASTRPKFVVSITPEDAAKNPQVIERLAALLETTTQDLNDKIDAGRRISRYDPVPLQRDVDIKILSRIEEQRLDLPSVLVTREPVRYYMDNTLCTHVLGVTRPIPKDTKETKDLLAQLTAQGYHSSDYIGREGLEKTYEAELRGQDGGTDVAVDARGRVLKTLGEVRPIPGHTLKLGIDLDLQRIAWQALKEQFEHKGTPGSAVAIDPNDGSVLAMVSMPTYDLNTYGKDFNKMLADKTNRPMLNRAIAGVYPSGSPFKLVTAAAGLETGTTTTETGDYCSGGIHLGRQPFRCDEVHGAVAFYRAIGASCNVFFYHTAQRAMARDPDSLPHWARQFGLGQKTGIDLPGERRGHVPDAAWKRKVAHDAWRLGDTYNMAIGQGSIQTTPLQLANYTAALANGGTLWKPHVVKEIIDPVDGSRSPITPEVHMKMGLQPQNRAAIVEGMCRAVSPGGTAYGAEMPGIKIAGKTGTAQAVKDGKAVDNSVFVCFAPADHPRIAIAVLVEAGGYGKDVAVPIAHRMLSEFFLHKTNVVLGN
jgi:penicillin-binding protein 2